MINFRNLKRQAVKGYNYAKCNDNTRAIGEHCYYFTVKALAFDDEIEVSTYVINGLFSFVHLLINCQQSSVHNLYLWQHLTVNWVNCHLFYDSIFAVTAVATGF